MRTFDRSLAALGLDPAPPLHRVQITDGADTSRHDPATEAAGRAMASMELSRVLEGGFKKIKAAMLLYDAFHRQYGDATGETLNWPTPVKAAR